MLRPLAVSLGDPAGIGPEIVIGAWERRRAGRLPAFVVCGGIGVLRAAAERLGRTVPIEPIDEASDAATVFDRTLPVLGDDDAIYRPGEPDPEGAQLALRSLEAAVGLARDGRAGGLVTAPVAKSAVAKVGFDHPGQTEFCAAACGLDPGAGVMMLAGPSLRTVPVTVHCALGEVPRSLSRGLIEQRARVVHAALIRDFGIETPRLAVAGLNPHAGEAGRFGDEEARIIAPAITTLRSEGLAVTGPHPADALFAPRARAGYDAALCMYHDQALIPVKALDFDRGVNVTLGLPIVRTSPDHGTAFDIAGQGIADPGAMIAAIRMAGEIAARRA